MNIFARWFFIACFVFHPFVFSQAKNQEQRGALLDLCLAEITTRRISLAKEMQMLSTEMSEVEDDSMRLSEYDDHIHQTLIKALILNTVTAKPILVDLSETTCDIFLDEMTSDPKTKSRAVNMFFSGFTEHTDSFIKLELMNRLFNGAPSSPMEDGIIIPEAEPTPPPNYIKI